MSSSRVVRVHVGDEVAGRSLREGIAEELRREDNEEVYRCESCGLILYTLEPVLPPAHSSGNLDTPAQHNS